MENEITNKYILYAEIKPYDLKFTLIFHKNQKICHIQEFIDDTMRNFRTRYKIGRIENKKTSSVLLPDYKIGEVLENKDEIVVYSVDYGLTRKKLPENTQVEDIDKCYIAKKTKRDGKSLNDSLVFPNNNFGSKKNNFQNKGNQKGSKEKGKEKDKEKIKVRKNESDDEDEESGSKKEKASSSNRNENSSDEDEEEESGKKKSSENNSDSDNDSKSGEDKDEDIPL